MDATLKELTALVREVREDSRSKGTYFDFARIFPVNNNRGGITQPNGAFTNYNLRDIGTTVSGKKGVDDSKTLKDCGFEIGDYLDISISPPGVVSDRQQRDGRGDHGRHRFGGGGRRDRDRRRPY